MPFQSKKSKAGSATFERTADALRGRAGGANDDDVSYWKAKLQEAEQANALLKSQAIERKEVDIDTRKMFSEKEAELSEEIADLKRKTRNLKNRVWELERGRREQAAGDEVASREDDRDENKMEKERSRSRPKIGSYKKVGAMIAKEANRTAQLKFQNRKLHEFETAMDNLFGKPFDNIIVDDNVDDDNVVEGGADDPLRAISPKRGYIALRWVLHKVLNKHPHLWHDLLKEKKTVKQAEMGAIYRIRKHWEEQGLNVFTRGCFTEDGWQMLINLLSNKWDKDSEIFERVLLPGGTPLCLLPSVRSIIKQRNLVAAELGLTADEVSSTFNVRLALVKRLEHLDNLGLLSGLPDDPDCLLVQLLADACGIFKAKNTNATCICFKPIYDDSMLGEEHSELVNSRQNLVLLCLYKKDDSYGNLITFGGSVKQQCNDIMQSGIYVNDKHWKIRVPIGGDLKLLTTMLGIAAGKSDFPCIYCKCQVHDFWMDKKAWEDNKGGLPLRSLEEQLQLSHIPPSSHMGHYTCPAPSCGCVVKEDSPLPDASAMKDNPRREQQRMHFGGVPGRTPYLMLEPWHLVMDSLHLILRSVPILFRQTISANCNKQALEKVAQWVYDNCDVIISSDVALQTDTGTKKLSMSSETWPGHTCRVMMDHFEEMLQLAIPKWTGIQQGLYNKCIDAWETFYHLSDTITRGCGSSADAWQQYADTLDSIGAEYLTALLKVTSRQAIRSPYIHLIACHLGDIVKRWGPLTPLNSQAVESIHQWIKFFATSRSNRRCWQKTTAIKTVARQHAEQEFGPARRSMKKRARRAIGHASKEVIAKHKKMKIKNLSSYCARREKHVE